MVELAKLHGITEQHSEDECFITRNIKLLVINNDI